MAVRQGHKRGHDDDDGRVVDGDVSGGYVLIVVAVHVVMVIVYVCVRD